LPVAFESVGPESPSQSLSGEWNALALALEDGATRHVRGRGAGRWPTTEAVIADVFEIARLRLGREREQISGTRLASA
jgi:homoserine dehydrogenase